MKPQSPQAILHDLERFRQMGSVLYIGAHPDDENTELLAYLSRGRNYRTAYLSLTRGDGGQNVLGPELGAKLGIARTQELLAARHIDGAEQFFSRAVDFGFSKDYQETLKNWDKEEVLSDMVRVIREFRPDILITRFSPSPGGTHGHHTASAVLALEAFKLSGDPKAFPEQKMEPWQPKRIFWNISTFQKEKAAGVNALKIDAGGKDSVSGDTFVDIAQKSRAMHKTQGFDTFKFTNVNGPTRLESFQFLDGSPVANDIMDGIDTTWARVPNGVAIGKQADEIIAKFNSADPSASVPAILKLRSELAALPEHDSTIEEKRKQLDHILKESLGLAVETTIPQSQVVPGEELKLHHSAQVASSVPVKWVAVRYPLLNKEEKKSLSLISKETASFDSTQILPLGTPLTQPYWLRAEGTPGMVTVEDPKLIGTPENAPSFPIEDIFEVDGQTLVVSDVPVQVRNGVPSNQERRSLEVIAPVSLRFQPEVRLLAPGKSRDIQVEVTAARANINGILRVVAPSGWKVWPQKHPFQLNNVGQKEKVTFTITAPSKPSTAKLTASAEVNGKSYSCQREEVDYPHLPPQIIQSPAIMKAVSFELATRGHMIGYLPGAGDSLAENLEEMGYTVKTLDDHVTPEQLKDLDAVVVGVRAFNVREKIGEAMPALFDYVKNGGTLIVQYNRPDKLKSDKLAPYDLTISPDRVTDETATMTFVDPESPILNSPNKLTQADFANWVQERGIYFPNKWDEHFKPVLECNDPGEKPTKGSLLVAQYGKGYYIYTGLVFFRQLPAGVPGAYRLFANMVSIGK